MSDKATLGQVIREMVKQALKSEDKQFSVTMTKIASLVGSENDSVPQLKSSYIYNTTARMPELRDAGLKATHYYDEDTGINEFTGSEVIGDRKLVIKLVPGTANIGIRKKTNNAIKDEAVSEFKVKISKVMPDLSEYEGAELAAAMKAIKDYRLIIEEIK
jgi:predicted transcriptional regulator